VWVEDNPKLREEFQKSGFISFIDQIGIMEVMSASTTLGANTLDNFSHGNSYRVTSHTTAMDVFTVDSVGRNYAAAYQPPPPYSSKNNNLQTTNGNALNAPEVTQNGNGSLTNGQTKIYDPNEDNDDSLDELETRNT